MTELEPVPSPAWPPEARAPGRASRVPRPRAQGRSCGETSRGSSPGLGAKPWAGWATGSLVASWVKVRLKNSNPYLVNKALDTSASEPLPTMRLPLPARCVSLLRS